ncbi:beta-lactamase family protein [Ignavigranum ruoffiae]|uniref:serine hydrolase domain-containing protein n=1 Tax=Ignavigranum ruoffiae TaxID=89093 RepID=UPI002070BE74|nr:serine hydrolase domain-containing protein [Ignavigranum ruoffiae]UPQ85115.1 beta-lactamase family protein [Ignavigranum ruoffiae]
MKIIKLISFIGLSCCVILGSMIEVVAGKEDTTPSGMPIDQLATEIDRFMDEHIGSSSVGASVAIAKDGEIILSKGYGYANVDKKLKVTEDTVFEYGSISKLFVWTSILKLVEAGQINLDHNIKEYLPESFNNHFNPKYPISMRNIMNHSSGFGEYPFDLLQTKEPDYQIKLEDALSQAHPRQYYRPGTLSSYSNYATALAALVVEHLTQTTFDVFEKEQIFKPLEMRKTSGNWTWKDNSSILANKAEGYVKAGNQFKKIGWSYIPLYPAGSVNGTANDLCYFAIDLMQQKESKLLQNETLQQIFQTSVDDKQTGTSYGFFTYKSHSGQAFGHGGNTAGFSTQLSLDPESKFAMIVLTNTAGEIEITAGLHELLFGDSMDQIQLDQANLPDVKTFEGNFVTARISVGTRVTPNSWTREMNTILCLSLFWFNDKLLSRLRFSICHRT